MEERFETPRAVIAGQVTVNTQHFFLSVFSCHIHTHITPPKKNLLLTMLEVVGYPQDFLATDSVEGSCCKLCQCEMDLSAIFAFSRWKVIVPHGQLLGTDRPTAKKEGKEDIFSFFFNLFL